MMKRAFRKVRSKRHEKIIDSHQSLYTLNDEEVDPRSGLHLVAPVPLSENENDLIKEDKSFELDDHGYNNSFDGDGDNNEDYDNADNNDNILDNKRKQKIHKKRDENPKYIQPYIHDSHEHEIDYKKDKNTPPPQLPPRPGHMIPRKSPYTQSTTVHPEYYNNSTKGAQNIYYETYNRDLYTDVVDYLHHGYLTQILFTSNPARTLVILRIIITIALVSFFPLAGMMLFFMLFGLDMLIMPQTQLQTSASSTSAFPSQPHLKHLLNPLLQPQQSKNHANYKASLNY